MDGSYPKSEWPPNVRSRKPFIYNKIPSLPLKHISELAQYGCFNGTSSLSFLHQKQPTMPTHVCELFLFLQWGSKHFSSPGVGFRSLHFILVTGELWRSVFFSGADGGHIGMLKIMQSKLKVGLVSTASYLLIINNTTVQFKFKKAMLPYGPTDFFPRIHSAHVTETVNRPH